MVIKEVLITMINVSVRITESMKLKLLAIADDQSITLPDAMRIAFMNFINQYEKQYGKIDLEDFSAERTC